MDLREQSQLPGRLAAAGDQPWRQFARQPAGLCHWATQPGSPERSTGTRLVMGVQPASGILKTVAAFLNLPVAGCSMRTDRASGSWGRLTTARDQLTHLSSP